MPDTSWTAWSALQARIPESERFEQTFVQLALPLPIPNTATHSLAAETNQAVLEHQVQGGRARIENSKVFMGTRLMPDDFKKYVP